jgi:hypothetical protein
VVARARNSGLRFVGIGAGLLVCLAAGALASIAVATSGKSGASAAYYYYCPGGGAGSNYGYCPPTTTTPNSPPVYTAPDDQFSDEGETKSFDLGSFSDSDNNGPWQVTVTWGDGSPPETFAVATEGNLPPRTHTYAEDGNYTVTVTVKDAANGADSGTFMVTVRNLAPSCGPIVASPAAVAVGTPVLATSPFTDPGIEDTHTGVYNWGDSSTSSATIVEASGSGTATGSHTYSATGFYTVTLTVTDDEGDSGTCRFQFVLVFGKSAGGTFVIGDLNSAVGTPVYFWGAQWWQRNSLSGGPAPASFKGFANTPTLPACGTRWSTRPGNSSDPPGTIPALMAVIASSSISKSGSTISGNTPHIVVVQTNPGYAPNPGHPGTGRVVGVVC